MSGAEQAPPTALRLIRTGLAPGSRIRAVLASVLLHALAGTGLWHFDRAPAAGSLPPTPGRAIELRVTAAIPEPVPVRKPEPPREAELVSEPAPPGPTARAAANAPAVDPAPDGAEAQSGTSAVEPAPENASEQQSTPTAASDDSAAEPDDALREPLVPAGVDMEAVRRDAVARVVATLQQQARQRTFSLDDAGESSSAAADGDAEPALNVFEAARAAARSNGVLARGRPRSAFMRNVADLCNELTGGFSILGLVNVCADPRARADLFGHLRPQYMESVPLCTADEELLIQVEETAAGAVGELKCVLVPRAERAEYYSRYDPELAGWLPAEEDATTGQGP